MSSSASPSVRCLAAFVVCSVSFSCWAEESKVLQRSGLYYTRYDNLRLGIAPGLTSDIAGIEGMAFSIRGSNVNFDDLQRGEGNGWITLTKDFESYRKDYLLTFDRRRLVKMYVSVYPNGNSLNSMLNDMHEDISKYRLQDTVAPERKKESEKYGILMFGRVENDCKWALLKAGEDYSLTIEEIRE